MLLGWFGIRSVLPRQARHPEAVIRVRGKQGEKGRGRVRRVAYRDVQFIRGHHSERRISILPPELVPDHGDFNRVARPGGVLDAAITRAVARNRTTTIRIGMTVHASSS